MDKNDIEPNVREHRLRMNLESIRSRFRNPRIVNSIVLEQWVECGMFPSHWTNFEDELLIDSRPRVECGRFPSRWQNRASLGCVACSPPYRGSWTAGRVWHVPPPTGKIPDNRCTQLWRPVGDLDCGLKAEVYASVPSPRAGQSADYPQLIDSRPSRVASLNKVDGTLGASGNVMDLRTYRENFVRSAVCRRARTRPNRRGSGSDTNPLRIFLRELEDVSTPSAFHSGRGSGLQERNRLELVSEGFYDRHMAGLATHRAGLCRVLGCDSVGSHQRRCAPGSRLRPLAPRAFARTSAPPPAPRSLLCECPCSPPAPFAATCIETDD
uniref:Uncharacterized protein n=1 Tax=Ananas comosus var. bracteatus TaxID=296719 RepID=A0A6V7Q2D4_ANACO|nr:unnamed protein product [Ananas comosus var. bracteatus]